MVKKTMILCPWGSAAMFSFSSWHSSSAWRGEKRSKRENRREQNGWGEGKKNENGRTYERTIIPSEHCTPRIDQHETKTQFVLLLVYALTCQSKVASARACVRDENPSAKRNASASEHCCSFAARTCPAKRVRIVVRDDRCSKKTKDPPKQKDRKRPDQPR